MTGDGISFVGHIYCFAFSRIPLKLPLCAPLKLSPLHRIVLYCARWIGPKEHLPLPRFKQLITISGASYHIVRCQFPVMSGYAVTVHRVQGLTVKKAVVLLNKSFFESGQAYVAFSRVRNLEDLTIWKYHCSAIHILGFYKQLLQWCDAQDVI